MISRSSQVRFRFVLGGLFFFIAGSLGAASLEGKVLEKGTRGAVVGASIFLEEWPASSGTPKTYSADAEESGHYLIPDVLDAEYRISVTAPGFEKIQESGLKLQGAVRRDFRLLREGFTLPEVVVSTKRLPKTAVSRQVLSKEELVKVPGSANDALRALETLPGVTTADDFTGVPLVRGGGPNDNLYYLDRIPYAFPYHFGGIISTLNSEMIRNVDFAAGGYGPEYGNCWGGIIDVTQRDPRSDRWGGRADVNLLLSDVLLEGPTGGKSSLSVSGRRSYLEVLGGFFDDFTAIPSFGDYQVKESLRPSPSTFLDFQAFGSDDNIGLTVKPDSELGQKDPAYVGEFRFHNWYHSQGANLKHLAGENDTFLFTLFHYKFKFDTELGRDLFLNFGIEDAGLRSDWLHSFGTGKDLRMGGEINYYWARLDAYFPRMPSEGSVDFDLTSAEKFRTQLKSEFWSPGIYAEQSWRFFDRFQVALGGRYDYFAYNKTHDWSPRVQAAYDLSSRTTLKASWGWYHQLVVGAELDPVFGNPGIKSNRSQATVLGVEQALGKNLQARVEGYHKKLTRVVVTDPVLNYSNQGVGTSEGLEWFLRRTPSERFFGWLSYTWSRSRRQDHPADAWRWYDYDQPHNATLVAGYRLTRKWEIGFKWRYASGQPETPVVGSTFDAANNRYRPLYGPVNSARKPAYHRLDLSVSRQASFNNWQLRWYLEILNVYNSKNVLGYDYNNDYTEREEIKQLPFLPYLGVEAKF